MMDELPELELPRPLRTERLELRPFTREELEAVADGRALAHFADGFPAAEDRDWARSAIEAGEHFFTETPYSRFAAVELASEEVVGTGGFTGPAMNAELEVEGAVVPGWRHRGLAAEALAVLVKRAFEDPEVRGIHASIPAEPTPAEGDGSRAAAHDAAALESARRLLTRAGFVRRASGGSEDSYHLPRP